MHSLTGSNQEFYHRLTTSKSDTIIITDLS